MNRHDVLGSVPVGEADAGLMREVAGLQAVAGCRDPARARLPDRVQHPSPWHAVGVHGGQGAPYDPADPPVELRGELVEGGHPVHRSLPAAGGTAGQRAGAPGAAGPDGAARILAVVMTAVCRDPACLS